MSDEIIFGNNVKRLMTENGLTKREMCKIMHIGYKSLVTILNGKIPERLSSQVLVYLSKYFKKPPSYFFHTNISIN